MKTTGEGVLQMEAMIVKEASRHPCQRYFDSINRSVTQSEDHLLFGDSIQLAKYLIVVIHKIHDFAAFAFTDPRHALFDNRIIPMDVPRPFRPSEALTVDDRVIVGLPSLHSEFIPGNPFQGEGRELSVSDGRLVVPIGR